MEQATVSHLTAAAATTLEAPVATSLVETSARKAATEVNLPVATVVTLARIALLPVVTSHTAVSLSDSAGPCFPFLTLLTHGQTTDRQADTAELLPAALLLTPAMVRHGPLRAPHMSQKKANIFVS